VKEVYRKDYLGELVIKRIVIRNGKKERETDWVSNTIDVTHVSNKATCMAESKLLKQSFYNQVANNSGGNLGKDKMQVYGVDSAWKYMEPDFLVTKDKGILEAMIKCRYPSKCVVYTSSSNCIRYPGEFYNVPYGTLNNTQATAIWLACFDGHKEVYIVGYDHTNPKIVNSIESIIKAYKNVKFIHVTDTNSPHEWKRRLNFSALTKNQYVSHCDV